MPRSSGPAPRWLAALVLGTALWVALRAVTLAARRIQGDSMLPTLRPGELILVVPAVRLQRGDVVVVRDPRRRDRETVKRVTALAGEVGDLPGGPATVLPGHLAVGGDNRAASTDSRAYGAVPRGLVVGRVLLRLWPPRVLWRDARRATARKRRL